MPSSVVAGMKYDAQRRNLQVRFVSGLVYEYADVPEDVFEAMKNAPSKGIFLNRHIKGHYTYKKLKD